MVQIFLCSRIFHGDFVKLFRSFTKRSYTNVIEKGEQSVWNKIPPYMCSDNPNVVSALAKDMIVYENFLSEIEEKTLLDEIEPYLKKLRYEYDHWDDAIHGYRETEKPKWNEQNNLILKRVHETAFSQGSTSILHHVHVLDLAKNGYIKPHVDSVRFCGNTIAGLSLLSSSVMRLVNEKNTDLRADILLGRRSLYIMRGSARYDYAHELLGGDSSTFKGTPVHRQRRVSVICRNEPPHDS